MDDRPPDPPAPEAELCGTCTQPFKAGAGFCAHCGRPRDPARPREPRTDDYRRADREWGEIRFVFTFYLSLLAIQAISLIAAKAEMEEATVITAATLAMAAGILLVAALHRDLLRPAFSRAGFPPLGYLAVVAASLPVLLAVHAYVQGLSSLFRLRDTPFISMFGEAPLAWIVVIGAVAPAVFEELAFRGLIFGLLKRHLRTAEVFVISSFAFAILHLSVPSLVTHVPMGLYFCWLRHRSGSIYPGIVAHFAHNFGLILGEHYGLLPRIFPA